MVHSDVMPASTPVIRLRRLGEPDSHGPPKFERVAVVGLGGIGGAIAMAARRAWPAALVIGVDQSAVVERAAGRHLIDVGSEDLGLVSEADLILLTRGPTQNAAAIGRLGAIVDGECVVSELDDRAHGRFDAGLGLPPRLPFIPAHLVADAAPATIDEADPDWLAGRSWLLVARQPGPDPVVDRMVRFVAGLGADPLVVSEDDLARRLARHR